MEIHGIGLYSALLIVGELGEVDRFHTAKQVGAYAGLTARVNRSGGHCYQGSIARQGDYEGVSSMPLVTNLYFGQAWMTFVHPSGPDKC